MSTNYEISKEVVHDIQEDIKELDKLLTERISELHEVQGMQQCRHAYIYYRSLLWKVNYALRDNLKETKSK